MSIQKHCVSAFTDLTMVRRLTCNEKCDHVSDDGLVVKRLASLRVFIFYHGIEQVLFGSRVLAP